VDEDHPLRPELGEFGWHTDDIAGGRVVYLPYPERHSNHSCDPNSYDGIVDGVTCRFALKDIAKDQEVTTDYCINAPLSEGVLDCNCGTERCRGRVVHGFFALPLELQIEYLPLLLPWFVEENSEAVEKVRLASSKRSAA
jgi:SET domain